MTIEFAILLLRGQMNGVTGHTFLPRIADLVRQQDDSVAAGDAHTYPGQNNFEIGAHIAGLAPRSFEMKMGGPGALIWAMREVIHLAASALANTVALVMGNESTGHIVLFQIGRDGMSTFFDANSGIYQFDSPDRLCAFWQKISVFSNYPKYKWFRLSTFAKIPLY
ncbi:hypothetical protein KNO81_37590 [Paraburkholderia sediminicola]|nr:hypothetical protein [Paraburkholderia sediminicola]